MGSPYRTAEKFSPPLSAAWQRPASLRRRWRAIWQAVGPRWLRSRAWVSHLRWCAGCALPDELGMTSLDRRWCRGGFTMREIVRAFREYRGQPLDQGVLDAFAWSCRHEGELEGDPGPMFRPRSLLGPETFHPRSGAEHDADGDLLVYDEGDPERPVRLSWKVPPPPRPIGPPPVKVAE